VTQILHLSFVFDADKNTWLLHSKWWHHYYVRWCRMLLTRWLQQI